MVLFSAHNVIADPPFSNLDLVSCRNLLIYLGYHLQGKLIPVFHYALKPEGYLFLGNSENLQVHKNLFAPIHERHRISRHCEVDQVLSSLPDPQGMRRHTVMKDNEAPDLGAIAQRIVLDEFTPQWAIVNVEYMPVLPGQAQFDSAELDSQEQVQTLNGLCYLRQVLPYRSADNQPSGVVVTFTDITHTMAAEQFTRNVINSLRSFVGVCSTDGTLLQANQSALIAAGIS